ncbi:antitoxin component YwqK of YwqJK toxin-antitoxin module [Arcicella rosea]|uniref:toxin-antitoxin system YwqK family antitoxin n=1 Tax=Arcicella rosea TaxID=502909 RepID=UPI00345CF5F0|eukprot:Opistho-1_new@81305
MKSIVFFLILIFSFVSQCSFAQNDEFKTNAKPKTDTSAKKKGGILGGLIQSDLLDNVKNAKKTIKDNQDEFKRLSSDASDLTADLGLKINKSKKKSKVKKQPKDSYEDIKFELRIGEYGSGTRLTVEEIHVLRNPDEAEPSIYAKEIWWYDPKLRRVTNVPRKDKNYGEVCHGPYKKYVNDELVEEGFFYVGVKDGRWETYNQEYILLTKEKYKKGFFADSKISYYDKAETKIKEVVPVKYNKVTGEYRSFYEGGQLKEEGKFDDSVKIGRWREYHQFGAMGRLKKETLYPKDKFDTSETVVLQERDNKGKIIYEAPKAKKKSEDEEEN